MKQKHTLYKLYPYSKKSQTLIYVSFETNTPYRKIFNPVNNGNFGKLYKTNYPQKITLSIQDRFIIYIDKLIEHNENLDSPIYRTSHLESPKEKYEYCAQHWNKSTTTCLITLIIGHNTVCYESNNFNTNSFRNLFLMAILPHKSKMFITLLNFGRDNYQILYEQQDQSAYINFPQVLTETEFHFFKTTIQISFFTKI